MEKFIWTIAFIIFLFLPFNSLAQQNTSSYYNAAGFAETLPTSYIENSFPSPNILYDATTISLLERKGYPVVGMIFITIASQDNIVDKNQHIHRIPIFLEEEETINARFRLLNYAEKNGSIIETFVLILSIPHLEELSNSKDPHFFIASNRFSINNEIRSQISSLLY